MGPIVQRCIFKGPSPWTLILISDLDFSLNYFNLHHHHAVNIDLLGRKGLYGLFGNVLAVCLSFGFTRHLKFSDPDRS